MKKSISLRQTGMLIVMMILANKILLLPSLLYKTVKTDGVFVVMTLFLIDLLVFGVFIKLKLAYPDKKLAEILEENLGKIAAKLIFSILLVFFMFKVFLTFSIAFMYLKQQVYQNEFAVIAIICVLPVINHAVICGLRSFSRTIELFYYLVVGLFILCLMIALGSFKQTPTYFVSQPGDFGMALVKNVFSFGDYLFLFLVIDRIEIEKKDVKKVFKYIFLGIALVVALFFIYYSIYETTAFMHNYAIADILTITVEFNAIGRLDIVAMVTIMLLSLFQMEIFQYGFCECFVGIFKKLNKVFAIAVFDVLFLVVYYILVGRYETMVMYVETWLPYFAMVANYLLAIVFFGISFKKSGKNRSKSSENTLIFTKSDQMLENEGEEQNSLPQELLESLKETFEQEEPQKNMIKSSIKTKKAKKQPKLLQGGQNEIS